MKVTSGAVVFFTPHQDDETLTMAADIRANFVAGRQVVIVLVTDGSASQVRNAMCTNKGVCLTVPEFVVGRNAEQFAAIQHLAPGAQIFYENYKDGALTQAQATTVINKYVSLFPNGSYRTMSWLDEHPDHIALGQALRTMTNAGLIPNGDSQFEQFLGYWDIMPVAGVFVAADAAVPGAYDEYYYWNPPIGRYALGSQSVPAFFDAARLDSRSKLHQTAP
jgi:LmbE family N-acetylglucosaminyl deacetylase